MVHLSGVISDLTVLLSAVLILKKKKQTCFFFSNESESMTIMTVTKENGVNTLVVFSLQYKAKIFHVSSSALFICLCTSLCY